MIFCNTVSANMLYLGEDICTAAVREVLEETGIKSEFKSLVCFRHHHNSFFGLSDLYFVCALTPLTEDIQIQEDEIAECKWMPVKEFMELPYYVGVYKNILEIANDLIQEKYSGWQVQSLPVGFLPGNNMLYHGSFSKL
eukprot:TRINITY_DN4454_c0_g1_i1.p1 TRINITY_DN4454_c0_g1~~TRINITY_DN4454_c0_g1_i1.p1  ORF type:complete len:139 (-),score=13.45 TRINITY_DN4454_c0_g1_i1:24-440(-)